MTELPDFSAYCEQACRMLWGEPTRTTPKRLSWTNGDAYGGRTFDVAKRAWYDHGAECGGSTLELVAYDKGEPVKKLSGADFFEAWQTAHNKGWVPDPPPPKKGSGSVWDLPILRTFAYNDELGALRYEIVRFDTTDSDKRFRPRRPDGRGGWITENMKGVKWIPYRLDELIEGVALNHPVLICEGEHDTDTAHKLGYVATTNPGGVGKWRKDFNRHFTGADVIVVSDNDKHGKGQAHAADVAQQLSTVAARVRTIIMFPVKDLTDWIAAGHTREELDALIEGAPDFEPATPESEQQQGKEKAAGLEDRVALEFASLHASAFRYVSIWNRWMAYDGTRWQAEDTLRAFDESRKLCRAAGEARAKTVAAIVTLARADRRLAAVTDQWDADIWLLGAPGGTIDLRTGTVRASSLTDYLTKITTVMPGGDCPLWRQFLDRVTGGDVELQSFLQRVCGYALTGDTSEDALFFLYGLGANGKSVFIRTIAGILGDHHRTASMETFTVTNSERHPTDLAMLRGARLVSAIETEEGKRWDEAKIKALTGGDRITARFMRQDFFEYTPRFKLMIAGNHRPAIRSVDEAIRRRMNLIPFMVTIPREERDPELSHKLKAEWPGILAWMIAGCLAWQRDGLQPPQAVTAATEDYLEAEDAVRVWIDECCETGPNQSDSAANLWAGWKAWAERAGEYVGNKRKFSRKLEEKGFPREKGTGGRRRYVGLRFLGDSQ
jgi:putative DNA primase/helicase